MRSVFLGVLLVAISVSGWALSDDTAAAIGAAVLIGTAISDGEVPPGIAASIVKSLRSDGVGNDGIRNLFKALVDDPARMALGDTRAAHAGKSQGMGAFVQDAHARGLKGRALADAIHAEQARRGIPGHSGDRNDNDRNEQDLKPHGNNASETGVENRGPDNGHGKAKGKNK